jgi:type II secretory pathway pseudopilin PulG
MSHSPEHDNQATESAEADVAPPSIRDLNVPLILTIGIVSILLLIVIIVGTQAWFRYEVRQEFEQKVVQQEFEALQSLNREQRQRLTGPAQWEDPQAGTVSVPIDQAIDRLVTAGDTAAATQPAGSSN